MPLAEIMRECLLECDGDVDAARAAAEYILATQPMLSTDATGHEHRGKGQHGGEFTSKSTEGAKTEKVKTPIELVDEAMASMKLGDVADKARIDAITAIATLASEKASLSGQEIDHRKAMKAHKFADEEAFLLADRAGIALARGSHGGGVSNYDKGGNLTQRAIDYSADRKKAKNYYEDVQKAHQAKIEEHKLAIKKLRAFAKPNAGGGVFAALAHDIHNKQAQGILNRTLEAARNLTADARRDLASALRAGNADNGGAILNFIDKYRYQLAELLTTTQLAAVLEGAREVAAKVPQLEQDARAAGDLPMPAFDLPEGVHLPTIDEASRSLAERNVLTRIEYDALNAQARAKAMAVAGVDATDTLTKIRDTMAKNVREGADHASFRKDVLAAVDEGTFLSEAHLCFLPGTVAEGAVSAASKIWYDGPAIEIETASGQRLSVTINHPILTTSGWKYAGDIQESDNLACYRSGAEPLSRGLSQRRTVNNQNAPTSVEDIFEAIRSQSSARTNRIGPVGALDFHGDGLFTKGNVSCVRPNRMGVGGVDTNSNELVVQLQLMERGMRSPLRSPNNRRRLLGPLSDPASPPSRGVNGLCYGRVVPSFLRRSIEAVPIRLMRFGETADLDPRLFHATDKRPGGDVQLYRKLLVSFPGLVTANRVVEVKRIWWTGHVYDLQTATGFIVSQGIITGNSTIFRTNVQTAFSDGQMAVLQHPVVRGGFPYAAYDAIHDDRVREEHEALEHYGIGGTNVYRIDDPVFEMFRPPWDYNDRCSFTPLTVRQAADAGVEEAAHWLKTGVEPYPPARVTPPPFAPPEGFQRAVAGATMSVRLSMQPTTTFAIDTVEKDDSEERKHLIAKVLVNLFDKDSVEVANELFGEFGIALSVAIGTRRYSARSPGPGWVQAPRGPRGGTIWVYHGQSGGVPHAPPPPPPPSPTTPTPPTASGGVPTTATVYNNVMAQLAAGHPLSVADKNALAPHLRALGTPELKALYAALGGTGPVVGHIRKTAYTRAVQAILAGVPTAPPIPLPAAPTPPTPPPASAAPAHYQPPPPRLGKVGPYGGVAGTADTGMPANIDHKMVAAFPNTPNSLSKDFALGLGMMSATLHTPSGYEVRASWTHGTPNPGTAFNQGLYRIDVFDGAGKIVSTYTSNAPRDEAYITARAVQVAHWAEGEIARLAKQKAAPVITAPLAQFAHEYAAAAGVKSNKRPPFTFDDGAVNRAKMQGYLKSEFPKLIGAQQHGPHGGMDTIEHTMNIIHPTNLRTAGLPQRDAELLRLGMVYHDVGKQHDPRDPEHPRKSAEDVKDLLWQHGLTEREYADTMAVIKWHDAYGFAMQGKKGMSGPADIARVAYEYTDDKLPPAERAKEAKRVNDLLMRAWQSDVSSIPGLTSKTVPGRPDLKVTGFLDVDKLGPPYAAQVNAEIDKMAAAGTAPKSAKIPPKPVVADAAGAPPNLVAPGLKWGELVQRTDALPVGQPTPYDSGKTPPKEVYDEAHKHPDANFARAFDMGYDGPTGKIVNLYHGTTKHNRHGGVAGMFSTGIHAGTNGNNVFGHGINVFANGADQMTSSYAADTVVQMEVHTGRMVDHDHLVNHVLPAWQKANPGASAHLPRGVEAEKTAAALWAGYSSISTRYYQGEPIVIILDPARIRLKKAVGSRGGGYKGQTLKTTSGQVNNAALTPDERKTPAGDPNHIPTSQGKPKGWNGNARTT